MAEQIKITELKQQLPLEAVLEHYQLRESLKVSGEQLRGPCPFCEAKKAFTVKDNLYKCFRCNAAGSIIDFVMQTDGLTIRAAALKLQEILTGPQLLKKEVVRPVEETIETIPEPEEGPLQPLFMEVWQHLNATDAPNSVYEALGKIEDIVSTYVDHYHN